jgi:hypothetical protein
MAPRSSLALACAVLILAVVAPLRAEGPTRRVLAEKLFQEGKAAMEAKSYASACNKLQESHELDPAGGTILLLALCLEAQGKLASAWSSYHEAVALARRDERNDRAERALERIGDIEPKLQRLFIRVRSRNAGKAHVTVDGVAMPESAFDAGLPVDPGPHLVRVRQSGHVPWERRVVVAPRERETRIDVALARPRPTPAVERPRHWQTDAAIVSFAAGGAALVAALIAGGVALRGDGKADELCPDVECSDRRAVGASASARSAARVATVAASIGIVFGATGAVFLMTTPGHARVGFR